MAERPLLERLLAGIRPAPDAAFTPPPQAVGPGSWILERRLRFGGVTMPSRSTVIAIGGGRLALLSPPADDCSALDRIGTVSAIVAPNSFHYLSAPRYLERYPSAELFVAPGLPARVPALPRGTELTHEPVGAWQGHLAHLVLGPNRGLSEVLFFHAGSRTLILTDLASNLPRPGRACERWGYRLSGMPADFGPSRNARRLFLRNRASARDLLREVLRWPFERIVMAHGTIIEQAARERFTTAFARHL